MGRAKLKMELMSNERKRSKAFKRRREGLLTKIHELTTLCDVKACMIIYGPKQDNGAADSPPEVWPKCPDEVRQIIDNYKSKDKDSGCKKFGLSDFYRDRTRKVQEELGALRKQNAEAKYPAPKEIIDKLSEEQLRVFAGKLKDKAEFIRGRVQMLKMIMSNQSHNFYQPASTLVKHEQVMNQQNFSVPVNNYLSNNFYNQHQYPLKSEIDCYAQFGGEIAYGYNPQFNRQVLGDSSGMQLAKLNQNPMQNENDLHAQFGGEVANASAQFSRQILCDQAGRQWVVDPMVSETPVSMGWYREHVLRQAPSSSTASPPQLI